MATNQKLKELVAKLKQKSLDENVKIWNRLAKDLEKPARIRRKVNVYKLDKYAKDNETVAVPGKVLSLGELSHKVTVAAFAFSEGALEKLKKSGSIVMSLEELMQKNPKGKKVRILG